MISDDTVLMLEADVLNGHIIGNETGDEFPIMAHPPDKVSDISLEMWIDKVINTVTQVCFTYSIMI